MANTDDRYEMLRDRELSKLSWVVKEFFAGYLTEGPLQLKSLCGGGVPSSHPSLGLAVFFLSL